MLNEFYSYGLDKNLISKYKPTFQWGNKIFTNVKDMVTIRGFLFVLTNAGELYQRKGGSWENIHLSGWTSPHSILIQYDEGKVAVVQVAYYRNGSYKKYTGSVRWNSKLLSWKKIRVGLFEVLSNGLVQDSVKYENINENINADDSQQPWKPMICLALYFYVYSYR